MHALKKEQLTKFSRPEESFLLQIEMQKTFLSTRLTPSPFHSIPAKGEKDFNLQGRMITFFVLYYNNKPFNAFYSASISQEVFFFYRTEYSLHKMMLKAPSISYTSMIESEVKQLFDGSDDSLENL